MVKAWCLPSSLYFLFDRSRLLGQHVESHLMANAQERRINGIKAGWQNHPQTKRFNNKPGQLIYIHDNCVKEMKRRGYKHNSPLTIFPPSRFSFSLIEFLRDLLLLFKRRLS